MTFAPGQFRRAGQTPAMRMFSIFLMMLLFAVALWQISRKSPGAPAAAAISYTDFAGQVDKSNVASANLLEGRSTTQIQGQLRQPAENFTAAIPNAAVPDLMQRMQKQGTAVEVHETAGANPASATSLLINLAPLLVILVLAMFVFKMRRNQRDRAQQGTPSSGPLG
jgi:ATP-dependent Zn protease